MSMRWIAVITVAAIYVCIGCGSRISFSVNDLQKSQTVDIVLRSGESITGEVIEFDDEIIF